MSDKAALVLEDGTVFSGTFFGAEPGLPRDLTDTMKNGEHENGIGEVVFNTGMTGYYEILTDPSYTGQMVVMTYPHIGNYGVDRNWSETAEESGADRCEIKPSALIIRKLYRGEVPRGRQTLSEVMKEAKVTGIEGIDTRGLTLKIREKGSLRGLIVRCGKKGISSSELSEAVQAVNSYPSMEGRDLLGRVGTRKQYTMDSPGAGGEKKKLALIDYGIKANIIRELTGRGTEVTVFPSDIDDTEAILSAGYDGLMLSNGPGDPASLRKQIAFIKKLIGKIPLCGICLGHQLLALALGAETFKMKFGHHGCNHPVSDRRTGRTFVTSQNHGFAVDPGSLSSDLELRFVNANDNTVEGIVHKRLPIISVQFHPEASPGPLDSLWLFDEFLSVCKPL